MASVTVTDDTDTAVNDLFNGCHGMPRSYANTTNELLELGTDWEMAVALEAYEGEFASTATFLLHLFSFTTIIHTCRIAHHSFLKLYSHSRCACRWYFGVSP